MDSAVYLPFYQLEPLRSRES